MAKKFLTPIGLVNLASDPASGSEGQIYYNTTDDVLKIYVNGAWTTLTGGGGAAINVSASAPGAATEGDAWFDNTDGKFYVYDGSYWVETGQTDAVFSSYNRWTKVMSASASTISGLDDNGTSLDFISGIEQLYINGAFIDESSYTVSGGSAIILDEPVYSTDLVEVLWLENLVVSGTYSKEESDAKYLSLSTASSTYLTITSASSTYATTGYVDAAIAAFSTETFLIKAEAYTATAGDVVFVNSASGAYTITLPSTPTLGDKVRVIDLANNAATNNITIGRNGSNIDGVASNFNIDINNAGVELIYTNATYGWRTLND
jgi:hypothetical protein